jgi:FKBP-type peptidyl-prolyl cis-trans isomerase
MKNLFLFFPLFFLMACSQDNENNSRENLIQAEKFLVSNLNNTSVVEIEAGLQYIVLESSGSSRVPNLDSTITADFHGTLIDGSVFWSSIDNGEPLTIVLSQLIPGCQKAISMMSEGDSWRVFIHPNLAYGEEGRPGIPSNSALTFDITLQAVRES